MNADYKRAVFQCLTRYAATGAIAAERLKPRHARLHGARISTGEFRDVEECAKDRLDRHRPHGSSHGGTPAQGRPRRDDLEPHPRQGRAAGRQGRQDRRQARPTSPAATWCSRSCPTGKDLEQVFSARTASLPVQRQSAGRVRRLLDHFGRGVRRHPQAAEGARRRLSSPRRYRATPR